MAELQIIDQRRRESSAAGHTYDGDDHAIGGGLKKIGLAMKSRTWRRQGRSGLGPLQKQVLFCFPSEGRMGRVRRGQECISCPWARKSVGAWHE